MSKPKIIFFGNGPLADFTLNSLDPSFDIIFHAHKKENLETVKTLKKEYKDAYGVLASFGVIIKNDILELFEPEGIINIHPSALPDLRGPSPIESAILRGDSEFSVSIMKLAKEMDAGPLYFQESIKSSDLLSPTVATPEDKLKIYATLAKKGATWLNAHLENLENPTPQDNKNATFCKKLDKSMSALTPDTKTTKELLNEIRAFSGFPKSRFEFNGIDCIIKSAHISKTSENALSLKCKDGLFLCIDRLQPAGKKEMDSLSFINGYLKK